MEKIAHEYLAGFFDGEGYAGLKERSHRAGKPYIDAQVIIGNTNAKVLQLIQRAFAGRLYERPNGLRSIWILEWTRREQIITFLSAVYPHLIVKKARVGAILKYLRSRQSRSYSDASRKAFTEYQSLGAARLR